MIRLKLYVFASLCALALLFAAGCGGGGDYYPDPIEGVVQIKLLKPSFYEDWRDTPLYDAYKNGNDMISFILHPPTFSGLLSYDGRNNRDENNNIYKREDIFSWGENEWEPGLSWHNSYYLSDTKEDDALLPLGPVEVEVGRYNLAWWEWEAGTRLTLNRSGFDTPMFQRGKVYEVNFKFSHNDFIPLNFTFDANEHIFKEE